MLYSGQTALYGGKVGVSILLTGGVVVGGWWIWREIHDNWELSDGCGGG